jgi:hypothetical protein
MKRRDSLEVLSREAAEGAGMVRRTACALVSVLGYTLLTGCGDDGDDAEPRLRLDPETLEVSTGDGAAAELDEFRAAQHVYVGAVDDDVFIAVALDDDVATGDPQDVLVYLCNSDDIALYLGGEIDGEGEVAFDRTAGMLRGEADVAVGDDISVDMNVGADEATGSLTIAGDDPQSFTALPPEDGTNEGFYVALASEIQSLESSGLAPRAATSSHANGWIILNLGGSYELQGALTEQSRTLDALLSTVTETL